MLWDPRDPSRPAHTLNQHQSAVKAMAWCPWQPDVLATGGGTSDRTIKFWNAATGNCVNTVEAGSQVLSNVDRHTPSGWICVSCTVITNHN